MEEKVKELQILGLKKRRQYWFKHLEYLIEARKPAGKGMVQRDNQNAPGKVRALAWKKKKQQQKCEYRIKQIDRKLATLEAA